MNRAAGTDAVSGAAQPLEVERPMPADEYRLAGNGVDRFEAVRLQRLDHTWSGAGEHTRTRRVITGEQRDRRLRARHHIVGLGLDPRRRQPFEVVLHPAARVVGQEDHPEAGGAQPRRSLRPPPESVSHRARPHRPGRNTRPDDPPRPQHSRRFRLPVRFAVVHRRVRTRGMTSGTSDASTDRPDPRGQRQTVTTRPAPASADA